MPGLTGVDRISGFVADRTATAEQRSGDPADPRHGKGLVRERLPWQLQAWALSPVTVQRQEGLTAPLGRDLALPAGIVQPGTPLVDWAPQHSHAAPWPKGVETTVGPDAIARRLEQSAAIHASGTGTASAKVNVIPAVQDHWEEIWSTGPESATLQQPVNRQVRIAAGGFGSTDRSSNPRGVNSLGGMQNAHYHRRIARGRIPGNYQWLLGRGRPLVKSIPGAARPPVGAASPFEGQNPAKAFGVQGAVLNRPAADYEPPPDPYTAPPLSQQRVVAPGRVKLW